jgi:hypothetical protein
VLVWVDPLFTGEAAGMTVWGFCAGESNSPAGARHHGWRIVSRSGSMGDAALLACDVHVMSHAILGGLHHHYAGFKFSVHTPGR